MKRKTRQRPRDSENGDKPGIIFLEKRPKSEGLERSLLIQRTGLRSSCGKTGFVKGGSTPKIDDNTQRKRRKEKTDGRKCIGPIPAQGNQGAMVKGRREKGEGMTARGCYMLSLVGGADYSK